jgi:membrane fusion protein, hemolysin D
VIILRMVGLLLLLPGLVLLSEDASRVIDWVQGRGDIQAEIFLSLSDLGSRLLPAELLAQFITEYPETDVLLRLPAGPLLTLVGLLVLGLPLLGRRRMRDRKGTVSAADTAHSATTASPDTLDRAFLPAALELLDTPPSPIRIAGIWLICIAFATGLTWAYLGWLDIHAVAHGRIQPSGRSKVVQPLEPGRVVAVGVENGSRVAPGDVLVELDPTETGADREALSRDLESSRAEIMRRQVAITLVRANTFEPRTIAFPIGTSDPIGRREQSVLIADLAQLTSSRASLFSQQAERSAARDRLSASVEAREKLLALARERVDMRETLNDKGSLSRALVIDSLQQYETQATTQVSERGQLAEALASLVTLERKLDEVVTQFIADHMQKFAEAERKADRLEQELIKAQSKNERAKLRAPIAGTVQQLAVTTVGQVVTTGQALLTIVPFDSPIEIEVMIQNKDIGFVETGQAAAVKIESFPFTRYGTIAGTVLKVSRDAVDEREAGALSDPGSAVKPQASTTATAPAKVQGLVFPATIGLSRRSINIDGKDIPLSPGMSVSVEIRTGQRRAIDYVLSPLREVAATSGHER